MAHQTNNFMAAEEHEEEKRGIATDREANKKLTSSSSPTKFKQMGETRHITSGVEQ